MKALLIASITLVAIFSTSCNTFIGIGRDLRLLGEGLESSANKSKKDGANHPDHGGGAPVY